MRILITVILSFLSGLFLVGTPSAGTLDIAPSIGLPRVDFVKDIPMGGARKLLGWHAGNLYLAQADGSVDVLDKDGRKLLALQGKDGKGAVLLKQPEAIAVAENTIYVVDSETNQVVMFALDGKFKGAFGGKKGGFFKSGGANELSSPHGIALHEGIVYVADSGNHRIQMFGSNGVFLATLGIESAAENMSAKDRGLPYKLGEPTDIKINAQGQLYVLDADDLLIKVYRHNGAYIRNLPKSGKPLGFSMAPDGVYVADQDSLVVQKYDFNDQLAYSFGVKGDGRAQFKSIAGMVAAKDRQIFIGDSKKGVTNLFLAEAGVAMEPLPKSASPTSVLWQGTLAANVSKLAWNGKDTLYGVDAENKSVLRMRNGAIEAMKLKDIMPVSVAVDKGAALWVLDKLKMRVVKLDEAGNIIGSIGSEGRKPGQLDDPTDIAIASNGSLFVADRGNGWVQVFNSEGVFMYAIRSSTAGKLDEPTAIALDPQDKLFILDKGRAAVSFFSSKGEPLGEFGKDKDDASTLVKPVALMATQDEVFVLDSNQVKVYSHKGKYIRAFGAKGGGLGEFEEPAAITAKDSTTFMVAEQGNKRIQTFTTLYKPAAPSQLLAHGAVHAVELSWADIQLPYAKQYNLYRSRSENSGYVLIASSKDNQFVDQGLEAEGRYFYRVATETQNGYEGSTSAAVQGVAEKFSPPVLDHVQAVPSPWQLKMSWKPIDKKYLGAYLVYQKDGEVFSRVGESSEPEFTMDGLTPDTKYTFYISTRSTDGVESEKLPVSATTLSFNRAPLEIEVIKLRDVFSNTYKLYEQDGVGSIKLTNNTDKPIEKIKVAFLLKNVMDFPTEDRIDMLMPGQSEEISLKAVFNNSILTLSEDSSVQAMIEASYFENGKRMVYSKSSPVKIYDKHRLTWDERGRYASFVTPKDPPVMNFVRSVVTQFKDTKDEAQLAATVFDALGVIGMTYLPDPNNPYQITSGKAATVDYIQYPRETLARKSGDCDDLTAFYASALESMGISTLIVEVPGHMFMMFSTGIAADDDGYTMDDMYVVHDGILWIPVETTVVGSSFVKAWELGAANYYKWRNKGLTLLDVHAFWGTYKPATLPDVAVKVMDVTPAEIEKKFPGEFMSVLKISSQTKTRRYLQAIAKKPNDMEAHLQLGIVLAKLGDRKEAMKYFEKVIAAEPKNASAHNNRGNLFMMDAKYAEAQKSYQAATQYSGNDAEIWVNLAKSYKVVNNTKKAKEAFIQATKLDPSVKKKYKALALELLNSL